MNIFKLGVENVYCFLKIWRGKNSCLISEARSNNIFQVKTLTWLVFFCFYVYLQTHKKKD